MSEKTKTYKEGDFYFIKLKREPTFEPLYRIGGRWFRVRGLSYFSDSEVEIFGDKFIHPHSQQPEEKDNYEDYFESLEQARNIIKKITADKSLPAWRVLSAVNADIAILELQLLLVTKNSKPNSQSDDFWHENG